MPASSFGEVYKNEKEIYPVINDDLLGSVRQSGAGERKNRKIKHTGLQRLRE